MKSADQFHSEASIRFKNSNNLKTVKSNLSKEENKALGSLTVCDQGYAKKLGTC